MNVVSPRNQGAWQGAALLTGLSVLFLSFAASAQKPIEGNVAREPCRDRVPERRAYFGDLHVHTGLSLDAATMETRTTPSQAYRFARGERIGFQPFDADAKPMRSTQLARPLDFAAVTDHAELLGETHICQTPGLDGYGSLVCRVYRAYPRVAFFWMNTQASRALRHDFCGDDGTICTNAARTPWQEIRDAAEAAYDRSASCSFTSFTAYEWTGGAGAGNNFHRNVIFANDIVPELPISFIDVPELTQFWDRLDADCRSAETGCDVLVIPHNSNLSGGKMFRTSLPNGQPIPRSEAASRNAFEPLVEVMQHKGESECMFGLGNEDELCHFENLSQNNFRGRFLPMLAEPPLANQFVRNVLKQGLEQRSRLGVNPFQFGMIASTDTHLGTAGLVSEKADFPGHGGAGKPPGDQLPQGLPDHIDFNGGGLAVIWAEENSRASLFDGMKRRETYGTSGPRIQLRFFGGWELPEQICQAPDYARQGYAGGVAMGSNLPERPPGASEDIAPSFSVSALADPGVKNDPGTPLQRIQIIKGWREAGALHERVYEVAGDPNNGASVDIASCQTAGSGFNLLCGFWRDPDFDPAQEAFYYARVVENPVCRWSQQICIAAGVRCDEPQTVSDGLEACCSPNHRRIIQERAWSSPIWHVPSAR